MNVVRIILGIFFPEFFVVSDNKWNKIQKKIRKSIIYIILSILIITIIVYIDLPLDNVINPWAIIISFSLGSFGGLLFISGLRDVLVESIPGTTDTAAFIIVISSLILLTYGIVQLAWV